MKFKNSKIKNILVLLGFISVFLLGSIIVFRNDNLIRKEPRNVKIADFEPNLCEEGDISTFSPGYIGPGDLTFEIYLNIWNDGSSESPECSISFYASLDNDISPIDDIFIDSIRIEPLSIREIRLLYWEGEFPSDAGPGEFYIGYFLDSNNEIEEKWEDDNIGLLNSVPLVFQAPYLADLADGGVGNSILSPYNIIPGFTELEISYMYVKNLGEAPSDECLMSFYLSTDTEINSISDYFIGDKILDPIYGNSGSNPTWSGIIPDNIPDGDYYVGWIIDSENTIEELDESNNIGYHQDPVTVENIKEWTIMAYMDGDNNLEEQKVWDFLEMASVGSDSKINLIAQMDRTNFMSIGEKDSNYRDYGDWKDVKRFKIEKDMEPYPNSAIMEMGELNMGDPATLSDFISWSMENYPAKKYALIISDHGTGIMSGDSYDHKGWTCQDDDNDYDVLYLDELQSSLSDNHVDLLVLETCLMGSVEIHYMLKDIADVIVSSEDSSSSYDLAYDYTLAWLQQNPTADSEQLAQKFVNDYFDKYEMEYPGADYFYTMAVIRTIDQAFITSLENFIVELNGISLEQQNNIYDAKSLTQRFLDDEPYYIDLYNFAENIIDCCTGDILHAAAQDLMLALDDLIIYEEHDESLFPDAHGLSIYLPPSDRFSENYLGNDFTSDFGWDEFLISLFAGHDIPVIESPGDVIYLEEDPDKTITWTIHDVNFDICGYEVWVDGTLVDSGTWEPEVPLFVNVDDFEAGKHEVVITVSDGQGSTEEDTIQLIINDIPVSTHPDDFMYEPGTTGNNITWTINDTISEYSYMHYRVYLDGQEYGNDGYAFSEMPLVINIDGLDFGVYEFMIECWDGLGGSVQDDVIVTVNDIPEITHPEDLVIMEGEMGHSITWTVSDDYHTSAPPNPDINSTFSCPIFIYSGSTLLGIDINYWNPNQPIITHEIGSLSVGIYELILKFNDGFGGYVEDSVIVTVINNPAISSPDDIFYVVGETGKAISWIITDDSFDTNNYQVLMDGDSFTQGQWISGVPVDINIDELSVGIYIFQIMIETGDGGIIEDVVRVEVFVSDEQPIADFIADELIVVTGERIFFTFTGYEGNGPATFYWDFGDGETLVTNEIKINHVYEIEGDFTVNLTVVDINGDTSEMIRENYISVSQAVIFPATPGILMVITVFSIAAIIILNKRIKNNKIER